MVYVIICEGKTDSFIINQYMTLNGFSYLKKKPKKVTGFTLMDNQDVDYFEDKENDILAIWNIAGCGNLKYAINEIKKLLEVEEEIGALAIVLDKDSNEITELENDISDYFENKVKLQNNNWSSYSYENSFSQKLTMKTLLTVIPSNQDGALETIMLEALMNSGEEVKKLGEKVEEFINNLKKEKNIYLLKERNVVKSKLGCTINIIDPERTFKDIIPTFYGIPWSTYPIIQNYFEELKNYK